MNARSSPDLTVGTSVVVIGAGIIGATIAYELRKRGHDVILVDREAPGQGCSFGNSGAISPASVAPLALPGVLASVPRMLLDAQSPLRVPFAYLPRALPWLARFVAAAAPGRVARSAASLHALHQHAVARHVALAREVGVPELVVVRGHLHVYRDETALAADDEAWTLRRGYGFVPQRLDREGIAELEPGVAAHYTVGMYLDDHAAVRNPLRYVQAIVNAFTQRGGAVRRADVRSLEREGAGWQVRTSDGSIRCATAVVAAGAWSRTLLDPQGLVLPLESQRGYHVEFDGPSPITRTVVLTDRKAFATPMESGLRVGGTVEIGGLSAAPDWRRAETLGAAARAAFPALANGPARRWMGHRPCLPDSVPFVGAVGTQEGLFAAVGHGHLGVTDAPGTALRIAEAIGSSMAIDHTHAAAGYNRRHH